MGYYIEQYLETVATLAAVVVFITTLAFRLYHKQVFDLLQVGLQSMSAAGLVVSAALLYCVWDISLLPKLGGIRLYIAITGLSVFVLSLGGLGLVELQKYIGPPVADNDSLPPL